jgi:hypothetical protein
MRSNLSCRHEFINTDAVPPGQRFAFLRDVPLRRLNLYEPIGAEGLAFGAHLSRLVAPEGRFIDLRTTSGGLVRIRDESRPYNVQWTDADNHALHLDLPRATS